MWITILRRRRVSVEEDRNTQTNRVMRMRRGNCDKLWEQEVVLDISRLLRCLSLSFVLDKTRLARRRHYWSPDCRRRSRSEWKS
ncbi:hypothetical protein RRG08_051923 [Elysia crispata]|uniref:Uncharacterized protein n=1 Tax=Elysia crispata TaxID=231223 RepID=A0AAE0Y1T0_9GAST|nr:hypothetical protein RRG08_051923 [Elysia crispata]